MKDCSFIYYIYTKTITFDMSIKKYKKNKDENMAIQMILFLIWLSYLYQCMYNITHIHKKEKRE